MLEKVVILLLAVSARSVAADEPALVPVQPLHALINPNDYPQQAIINKQEGSVRFRLDVGPDGRVSGCTILRSSRSGVLDSATCRIMASRARFAPARDNSGKLRSLESTVDWRLGHGGGGGVTAPPRLNAITNVWVACAFGEAAKQTVANVPIAEVPEAAFSACRGIEPLVTAEMARADMPGMVPASSFQALKAQIGGVIVAQVTAIRKTLELPAAATR